MSQWIPYRIPCAPDLYAKNSSSNCCQAHLALLLPLALLLLLLARAVCTALASPQAGTWPLHRDQLPMREVLIQGVATEASCPLDPCLVSPPRTPAPWSVAVAAAAPWSVAAAAAQHRGWSLAALAALPGTTATWLGGWQLALALPSPALLPACADRAVG